MTKEKTIRRLTDYMRYRADAEGVAWCMPDDFLQMNFDAGIRLFFGVQIDDSGQIIDDDQNPKALEAYLAAKEGPTTIRLPLSVRSND